MDDETVRQLISMQEDLHNGIGRKRKKVSIGLHNLDVTDASNQLSCRSGLIRVHSSRLCDKDDHRDGYSETTETGIAYGKILEGAPAYPILLRFEGRRAIVSSDNQRKGYEGGHGDEEPLHRRHLHRRKGRRRSTGHRLCGARRRGSFDRIGVDGQQG